MNRSSAPAEALVAMTESAVTPAKNTKSSATLAAEPWWNTIVPSAVPLFVLSKVNAVYG